MSENKYVNIASYLPEMAKIKPHNMAVVCSHGKDSAGRAGYIHYTLEQLNEHSDKIAYGLEKIGIKRGVKTVLMVPPNLEFFALTFALFKVGAVPIIVDPGIGIKGMGKCLGEAEPYAFIGIPKAQGARTIFGWSKKTIKVIVTVGCKFPWGGYSLKEVENAGDNDKSYKISKTKKDDLAAILFTSGSTGLSKGAMYTHGNFDSQVKFLRNIYGIEPGEKDLSTFPLFALFGPALGMTSIIPDMNPSLPAKADPKKLIQAIEDFGATNMFGSPALINNLSRFGVDRNIKLRSLKRVISAGAPANNETIERFSKMLPSGVEIFTPYGATEALPVCNIGSREILEKTRAISDEGKGNCVGKPVEGINLKIIRITDRAIDEWSEALILPVNDIGEIVVQGPIVTKEYYNRPESTKLAKIPDPKNNSFYHRMGDVGYMDRKGRLWFCGRKSHRVETEEGTLYTVPCEAIFNRHKKVLRTALVGVEKGNFMEPVLCVELETYIGMEEENQIREELFLMGSSNHDTSKIKTILFHPGFPVDVRHNAKIFREKLAHWAKRRME